MSLETQAPPASESARAPRAASRAGRRSWPVVILLIAALGASTLLQQRAFNYREAAINRNLPAGAATPARVANLDSFSLALLLGGLRGPLVMYLWSSSETQKSENDLDSFDSKVEMIRLLQPEFDSVHLFQIWNKGYNISVKMASLANKYAAILDALEYARRANEANPNSINLISQLGNLFAEKLGASAEKEYYRRRVRTETLPLYVVRFPAELKDPLLKALSDAGMDVAKIRITESRDGLQFVIDKFAMDRLQPRLGNLAGKVSATAMARQTLRPQTAGRRTELDTMLTADGMILPELLKPQHPVSPGQDLIDGSELQFLAQFQPFPYGISPIALGYNYYKKSQILQTVAKQRHLQWSEAVVDNMPGLSLKAWAEEEADRARRLETRGIGAASDAEKLPRELRSADIAPGAPVLDRAAIQEAVFSYDRATQIVAVSLKEYERHLKAYSQILQNYGSHIDSLEALRELANADSLYLRAFIEPSETARKDLLARAKEQYLLARRDYHLLNLKYYTTDQDAQAVGFTRATVDKKSAAEIHEIAGRLEQHLSRKFRTREDRPFINDWNDYQPFADRIEHRLKLLK